MGDRDVFEQKYKVYTRQPKICGILTDCNFESLEKHLKEKEAELCPGESYVDTLYFGHWTSDIEVLVIDQNAPVALLEEVDECLIALADYPVFDEDAFSQKQNEEVVKIWRKYMNQRERLELCHQLELDGRSASRKYPPGEVYDHLYERLEY